MAGIKFHKKSVFVFPRPVENVLLLNHLQKGFLQ